MRCSKVTRMIDDHADGLLPADLAVSVRDHVERCAECRDLAIGAKVASDSLARWETADPADGPSAECFDRILARIDALPVTATERAAVRERPVLRLLRRWAMPAGIAAAAAFVIGISTGGAVTPARSAPSASVAANPVTRVADPDDAGVRRKTRFPVRPPTELGMPAGYQDPLVPAPR